MEKKTKTFTQLITIALACMIAIMYLCFSSCKKKVIPVIPTFYKVAFDAQGGSAINPTGVKPGSFITLPAPPKKAGATFDGWFTDKEGKNLFSEKTAINADLTLYAKWSEQFYTVTFDIQEGKCPTISPITGVKYGSNIIFPPDPISPRYLFMGWYADIETRTTPFSPATPITDNITLYARWAVYRAPAFELLSNSFDSGDMIPDKYTFNYGNVSPQLSWTNAPKKTKSFLIIMEGVYKPKLTHWTVYAIPADKHSLEENDPWLPQREFIWSKGTYQGPAPDNLNLKKKQTYKIKIYALDLDPDYFNYKNYPEFSKEAETRLGDHILAKSDIITTYQW